MRLGSPLLLTVLALAATSLAGCTDDAAPEPAAETPNVVTDPGDRTYLENRSLADGSHLHDYWNGAERLVVLEAEQRANNFYTGQHEIATFRPASGDVIPQGTSNVTVTLSWQEDGVVSSSYRAPELWIKTAADNVPVPVGPISNGETAVVPSTNQQNDLPHQVLSGWRFQLVVSPPDDGSGLIRFSGSIQITVVADRGLDIPLYPPHPDQWNGTTSLPLFEDELTAGYALESDLFGRLCQGQCPAIHRPDDGAIVPGDADHVRFVVEYKDDPYTRLAFRFHGADTWEMTGVEPHEDDGPRQVYIIPLEGPMGDGPYAQQSLWAIEAYVPQGAAPFGAYRGTYSITATAEALDP